MPVRQNGTHPEIQTMATTRFQKPQDYFGKIEKKGFTFSSKVRLKGFLLLEIFKKFYDAVAFTDGVSGSRYKNSHVSPSLLPHLQMKGV